MNTEYTPGKWEVRYLNAENTNDGECDFFVQAPKTNPKAACNIEIMQQDFGEHTGYPREQKLADAHLIAAAPDLLKELQHLVRLLQPLEENGGFNVPGLATLNGARLAIAKAIEP